MYSERRMKKLTVSVIIFLLSLHQQSQPCVVLRSPWCSTSLEDLQDGLAHLGVQPIVSQSLSLGECAQACLEATCKAFLSDQKSGRCFLSTQQNINCTLDCSGDQTSASVNRKTHLLFINCENHCYTGEISALGMESGAIPDTAITVSDETVSSKLSKNRSRLHMAGGWSSPYSAGLTSHNYWLELTLHRTAVIHRIATQGCSFCVERWVRSFSLQLSSDGVQWDTYMQAGQIRIFHANANNDGVVYNEIDPPIVTKNFRIYSENITELVIGGILTPALGFRFEIYGCWR